MEFIGFRPVILPDGGLLPVGIPLVPAIFLPTIKAWLVLPLVRAPPKDQRVLLPDAAPGKVKAHGIKRAAEDQAFGIRVEHIDAAVICQVVMHTAHGLLSNWYASSSGRSSFWIVPA